MMEDEQLVYHDNVHDGDDGLLEEMAAMIVQPNDDNNNQNVQQVAVVVWEPLPLISFGTLPRPNFISRVLFEIGRHLLVAPTTLSLYPEGVPQNNDNNQLTIYRNRVKDNNQNQIHIACANCVDDGNAKTIPSAVKSPQKLKSVYEKLNDILNNHYLNGTCPHCPDGSELHRHLQHLRNTHTRGGGLLPVVTAMQLNGFYEGDGVLYRDTTRIQTHPNNFMG